MKKQKLTRHEDLHKEWMKDPEYRKLYEDSELNFQVARALYHLRIKLKLTQKQAAAKLGIAQQSYAELEDMEGRNYTIDLLQRVANATNTELYIKGKKVKFIEKRKKTAKRAA